MSTEASSSPRRLHWVALVALAVVAVVCATLATAQHDRLAWLGYLNPLLVLGVLAVAYAPVRSRWSMAAAPVAAKLAMCVGVLMVTGKSEWAFYGALPFDLLALAIVSLLGYLVVGRTTRRDPVRVVATAGLAALAFFLVSNFGVWAVTSGGAEPMYARSLAGLATCYELGLPFLRMPLTAAVVMGAILFSPPALAVMTQRAATPAATTA